jgi:hypothetical protein
LRWQESLDGDAQRFKDKADGDGQAGNKEEDKEEEEKEDSPEGSMPCSSEMTSQNLAPIWFPH